MAFEASFASNGDPTINRHNSSASLQILMEDVGVTSAIEPHNDSDALLQVGKYGSFRYIEVGHEPVEVIRKTGTKIFAHYDRHGCITILDDSSTFLRASIVSPSGVMNPENFKHLKTQRGFTYRYYFRAPIDGKPVLFFSHGFPSGSYLWRKQVAYFKPLGYGLIVPDMLAYGGTDKPTDPKFYVGSGLAHDIVDILDAEKVDKVIAIAHDWGTRVVSRLANYHPDRLTAYAFLATGYGPPDSAYADPIAQAQKIKEMVGYDVVAYMHFFAEDDTPKLVEKNFDSFFSLVYPNSPEIWKDHMCSAGGAKAWVESNKTTPLPSYLTLEDKEYYRHTLLSGGMTAPFCWYKVLTAKCNTEDDERVPRANVNLTKPMLYVPFTKDAVALPLFGDGIHSQYAKGIYTRKELDGDHWAVMSQAHELNEILVEWINGLAV